MPHGLGDQGHAKHNAVPSTSVTHTPAEFEVAASNSLRGARCIYNKKHYLDFVIDHSKALNSQNKTHLQLTQNLLSFPHIEILHLAILQIPANIMSKHRTISRQNPFV